MLPPNIHKIQATHHKPDLRGQTLPALLSFLFVCLFPLSCFQKQKVITDDFLWLEELKSPKSLDWVKKQNAKTLSELTKGQTFKNMELKSLKILESQNKIPYAYIRGEYLYNFWRDKNHIRGFLRRTTYSSYKTKQPLWETVLDIDRLTKKEKGNWIYRGSNCLAPEYRHCLTSLSLGGKDTVVIREFDKIKKQFVPDGFFVSEGRTRASWADKDHLLIAANWGENSLTKAKYPRIVKLWKRGSPLSQAETIYEAKPNDLLASGYRFRHREDHFLTVSKYIDYLHNEMFIFHLKDRSLKKIPKPQSARILAYFKGFFIIILQEPLILQKKKFKTGAIIAILKSTAGHKLQKKDIQLIFEPKPNQSSVGYVMTLKDKIIFSVLEDVRSKIFFTEIIKGQWQVPQALDLPSRGEIKPFTSTDQKNLFFYTSAFFNEPPAVFEYEFGKKPTRLKTSPHWFYAKDLVVKQKFAASKDKTRIPYFLVYKKGIKYNSKNPTLLYGYGGFQNPMMPSYKPLLGKLFLERKGVYVLANIRGGGEYGPKWHKAALRENRQKSFNDFIAVAKDVIRNKITSPNYLAIQGGSNGGLLVGVAMTQRPELFKAAILEVPLLDMLRYAKLFVGTSWVTEYGDPEIPKYRKVLLKYSPYHNVSASKQYPTAFIYTSAIDDRVHPGHARKMTAKMQKQGHKVLYYEHSQGGHSVSANLKQMAKQKAMIYHFLWQNIFSKDNEIP